MLLGVARDRVPLRRASSSRTRSRASWRCSPSRCSSPSSPATAPCRHRGGDHGGGRRSPAAAPSSADKVAGASTQRVTSDRSRRIDLTAKVIRHHPLVGVGLGSQPKASQAVSKNGGPPSLFVSHTTPLTVFAELGIVGLALYAALLAGAGEGAPARVPARQRPSGSRSPRCSLALFVHSLFYSGFFEDPSPGSCSASPRASSSRAQRPKAETPRVSGRGSTAGPGSPCSACSARSSRERARARLRPVAVPDAADLAHGLLGPLVRAADGALGSRRRPHAGRARGRARRGVAVAGWRARAWRAWVLVAACVAVIVLRRRARDAAPGRACATRPAPWFHVNDSTYQIELAGDARPARPHPVRPRLRGLRAGAVLQPRRHRAAAGRAPAGRAPALRLLPRHRADRGRVELRSRARSTTTACSSCSRRSAASSPCSLFDAPLPWRLVVGSGARGEPAPRARRLVRHRRRAGDPGARCSRSRCVTRSRYVWAARRARRRDPAQAVRARRGAVLRR